MEQFASENKGERRAVVEAAKGHGLIAHGFYGSDDGGRLDRCSTSGPTGRLRVVTPGGQAKIGPR